MPLWSCSNPCRLQYVMVSPWFSPAPWVNLRHLNYPQWHFVGQNFPWGEKISPIIWEGKYLNFSNFVNFNPIFHVGGKYQPRGAVQGNPLRWVNAGLWQEQPLLGSTQCSKWSKVTCKGQPTKRRRCGVVARVIATLSCAAQHAIRGHMHHAQPSMDTCWNMQSLMGRATFIGSPGPFPSPFPSPSPSPS